MTHDELAGIIGALAHRLTQKQLDELEPIATSNPTGLAKVVANIENDPNIDSPVGTLLSRVRRADIPRARPARNSAPIDHRDWARRLYAAKITQLHQHDPDWSEAEKRQHAIDYALDHCRANGEALWRIEHELEVEHAITLTGLERDFERDTPHRRLMIEKYGPGKPLPWGDSSDPRDENRALRTTGSHQRCLSGSRCVIGVAGGGAFMTRLQRDATRSGYCIPCSEQRHPSEPAP